jgi:hypothetical protein
MSDVPRQFMPDSASNIDKLATMTVTAITITAENFVLMLANWNDR